MPFLSIYGQHYPTFRPLSDMLPFDIPLAELLVDGTSRLYILYLNCSVWTTRNSWSCILLGYWQYNRNTPHQFQANITNNQIQYKLKTSQSKWSKINQGRWSFLDILHWGYNKILYFVIKIAKRERPYFHHWMFVRLFVRKLYFVSSIISKYFCSCNYFAFYFFITSS